MSAPPVARRWWALGVMVLALLTLALDATVLHVALPTLAIELGASTSQLQWFANAYTLVLAAGMLPAGFLGDRFGQKRLFIGSLVVFGLASIGCAYADSAQALIAARVCLGVGAAFMLPLSLSLLTVLFSARERPRAIALWTTTTVVGLPLGPVLGGWLLDNFWWGSVFLINVPLIVVGVVALPWLLPRTPGGGRRPVDVIGIVLSSAGLVALSYGLIQAGERGWDPGTIALTAAGVAALAGFVAWSRWTAHPLVDLGLFRSVGFSCGSALATVVSFTMFGLVFVLPQYFQAVSGADALGTGLRVLPIIGGVLVGVQVGGPMRKMTSAKVVGTAGFGLMTAGLLVGATTDVAEGYAFVAGWLSIVGLGLGLALPVAMDIAFGGLPAGHSGTGSALLQALRQVGGTLGVAVLGTALNAGYRATVDLAGLPAGDADTVRRTAAAGVELAHATGSADLLESVRTAFVHGLGIMLLLCAAVTALATLIALAWLPPQADDQAAALARPEFATE